MTNYRCTLTPLGEYFFGGEKTFERNGENGENKRNGKSPYFIHSQLLPSQATLMGMIRFLVLKQKGQLNLPASETKELIGLSGFRIDCISGLTEYGKISGIGPLFLTNGRRDFIRTPLNHKEGEKEYSPFHMTGPAVTEFGDNAYLPMDFKAKDGMADSFICIDEDTYAITEKEFFFQGSVHTRIHMDLNEGGMFKKEYMILKKDPCDPERSFSFAFDVEMKEGDLLPNQDIVYLGQEKSTFLFTCVKAEKTEFKISKPQNIDSDVAVYYLLSDAYLKNVDDYCVFWCADAVNIRTIANSHDNHAQRSTLKKLYRRGSVFYVKRDKASAFCEMADDPGMQKVGYNKYIEMGEQNERGII